MDAGPTTEQGPHGMCSHQCGQRGNTPDLTNLSTAPTGGFWMDSETLPYRFKKSDNRVISANSLKFKKMEILESRGL